MTASAAPAFDPPLVVEWTETPASAAAAVQHLTRMRYRRAARVNTFMLILSLFCIAVMWGVAVARFDLDSLVSEALGLGPDWIYPAGVVVTIAPALGLMIAVLLAMRAAFRADLAPAAGPWRLVAGEETVVVTDPTQTEFIVRWDRISAMRTTPAIAVFAIGAMAGGWAPASAFAAQDRYVAFIDACAERLSPQARALSILRHRA